MVICLLAATALLLWPGSVRLRPAPAQWAEAGAARPEAGLGPPEPGLRPPDPGGGRRSPRMAVLLGICAAVLVGGWASGPMVAISVAAFLGTVALLARSQWRRRTGHRELAGMLAATRILGREIRAGAAPLTAIRVSAQAQSGRPARMLTDLAVAVAGDRGHGPPPDDPVGVAGKRGRADPAAEISGRLARAWQLSARYGVPLAVLVDTVSDDLADRLSAAAQRDAQVAGPRVSGYVLAAMPVLGVLLGTGMGADPLHVLFSTGPGRLMLLTGTLLTCAGLAWTARIVRG